MFYIIGKVIYLRDKKHIKSCVYMKKIIFTVVCFLFAFNLSAQQIRYVKQGGSGNGSSWAAASGDFQAMINASVSGDEVWVAEGTYQPAAGQFFSMKQGVRIYGGFPADNNSADMSHRNWNTHETILLGNGRSVIRNVFTSSNRMTSASVLDGFVVTGNNNKVDDEGAGFYNSYASPTLKNLKIVNNYSVPRGGAMYNNFSTSLLINVLFTGNRSNQGAVMDNRSSDLVLVNVTITKNLIGNSMIRNVKSNLVFRNSVVYGNKLPSITNTTSNPEFYFSLIQDVTTHDANGNIDGEANPYFNSNHTLALNSPLLNAGSNALYEGNNNDLDLNGNSRFFGTIDIGAFENQNVYSGPKTIYVKSGASGNNDGTSWEDAFTNLQQAINSSLHGDEIWVAAGTYQPAEGQSFSMKEGVKIYGGFPNDNETADMSDRNWAQYQTILLGNGRSVIRNAYSQGNLLTSSSVLDGFTITGNNVQVDDEGAGIYNNFASPILRNLRIINNRSAPRGGGMCNYNSSPLLANVLFSGNRSNQGSVMENKNSNVILENVTISGNTIGNSIIRNTNSNLIYRNTLVYGNKLPTLTNTSSSNEFYYSLVQGETTNDGNGNINGNIDPLFINLNAGNYKLSIVSPLVDAGNNALYSGDINEDLDLNGNLRLSGSSIDIGAFENNGCSEIAIWNGSSWSQTPTINTKLIIQGHFILNSNLEGCSLELVSGDMVVNSGRTLTIYNEVKVLGGTLTLRNQASLVQVNDVNNFGEIIVEKTTKPMDQSNYGYWSSPVEGWRLNELSPLTASPYFYSWNVNGQSWTQHAGGNQVMEAANGYIVRAPMLLTPQVHNLTFEGTPNNGDVEVSVLGAGNFNFLGNPYPSAINIETFLADEDNDELDKVVYLWTNGYELVGGNFVYQFEGFATYNAVGGAGQTQSPTTQMPTAMIASGQAFFITGNQSGTVVFKNSHRVVGNNNNSFNRVIMNDNHRYWVNLESEAGYYGQTLVGYLEGATNSMDKDLDAKMLENEAKIQVYTLLGDEKTIIQGRALPFDSNDSLGLGYAVKNAGMYSVVLPSFEGLFAEENSDIFLKDNLLNVIHDLKEAMYEFYSEAGTFNNRFEIVYKKSTVEAIDTIDWLVSRVDGQLQIDSAENFNSVQVFDMLGRLVYESSVNGNSFALPIAQNKQILVIRVEFDNRQQSVKKVMN